MLDVKHNTFMAQETRIELYKEALQQLGVAIDQLDQAEATFKDLGLQGLTSSGFRRPNIHQLVTDAQGLLEKLQSANAEESQPAKDSTEERQTKE